MSLIVEDGSGLTNAESYASVDEADTYLLSRGMTIWSNATATEKEQALRRATDFMTGRYRTAWKGYRRLSTQALDWPRYGVVIDNFPYGVGEINHTIVPEDIKKACAELALRASMGPLNPDQKQTVIQKTVGPITVKYDQNSPQQKEYSAVDDAMRVYLMGGTSKMNVSLVRV